MPALPTEGQPFMAVVLGNNCNMLLGPEVLGNLPFPIIIFVYWQTDVHHAFMQYYRGARFEVALLLDLADGSGGEKATETLKGALTVVSEVTDILESRSGVLQNDQGVFSAIVDQLAASGHGLLVYDNGMNPALEMAKSLGLPAQSIYRSLD